MSTALLFPGQGSQTVGMAAEFMNMPETGPLFDEANEILGFDLKALMRDGPEQELTLTENAQPALVLASVAALEYMKAVSAKQVSDVASYVAGHSVGEYSALVAAGSLSWQDALRLVRARGEAMRAAMPPGEGAMAAFIGLTWTDTDSICRNAGAYLANDNAPDQHVIAGTTQTVDEASNIAVMQDAKRVIRLDVAGPFHCELMQPAADIMAEALSKVDIKDASLPVLMNVCAEPITSAEQIKNNLVKQITAQVRWRETMAWLAENGVNQCYELGSGKVLTGLCKRNEGKLSCQPVNGPQDVIDVVESIATAA